MSLILQKSALEIITKIVKNNFRISLISRQQPTFTPIFKMRLVIINESKARVKNFAKPGDATLSDFGGRTLELQASFISNPPKRFPIRKSQKLI